MKLKYFLAFVFTFSVFANELVAVKNELFSELKKFEIKESEIDYSDRPLHYIQYLNVKDEKSKKGDTLKNYKIPRFKFYERSDLSGKPFAEIKDDGFYLDNERLCTMGSREGEVNKTEFLVSYDSQCTWDPILKLGNKYNFVIGMKLVDYNEKTKIGKVKIARRIGYVDLKEVKNKFLKIPTVKLIEKYYSKEEIKEIKNGLKKFREMWVRIFNKKQLVEYIYNNSDKKNSKYEHQINIYRKLKDDQVVPDQYRSQLFYSSFLEHMRFPSEQDLKKYSNSNPKRICTRSVNEYYICLSENPTKEWVVDWLVAKRPY